MSSSRYAIYFVPDAKMPLGRFGTSLLGYDSTTGLNTRPERCEGFDQETWHHVTAEPRRYGFHATLKAPFRLDFGITEQNLLSALTAFAASRLPVEIGPLVVTDAGGFIALAPVTPSPDLEPLAQACVEAFEPLRAPLSPAERRRRKLERLSPRQLELLDTYGYPYVAEEFRFHMTLTGPMEAKPLAIALASLSHRFQAAVGTSQIVIRRLALLKQSHRDEQFKLIASAPLGQAAARHAT